MENQFPFSSLPAQPDTPVYPLLLHGETSIPCRRQRGNRWWNSPVTQALSGLPTMARSQIPLSLTVVQLWIQNSARWPAQRLGARSPQSVSGFDSQIWHDQLGGSKQMTWNSSSTHPRMAVTVKSCLPGRFSHR